MAMVAAVELDNTRAAGRGARKANRGHSGFGAGAYQSHFTGHRDCAGDTLGDRDFQLGRSPVAEAAGGLLRECRDDLGMGVAENRWTV